jgi:hypothetical protein
MVALALSRLECRDGPGRARHHLANFLCPDDPSAGLPTYLIDWQGHFPYLGASDLVNLIATFWTREQRRDDGLEEWVLRLYLEGLQRAGVERYAWQDLRRDYRLAIAEWLLVPLQDRAEGAARDYWRPKLLCLAGAFEDLGGVDL